MAPKHQITLLAGSEETRETLLEQLIDIVGDLADITSYAAEEDEIPQIDQGIVVLSSHMLYEEVHRCIGPASTCIIAERVVNFHHIDALLELPEGTEVLYVNDSPDNVHRSIDSLRNLGIDHLNYFPYFPGKKAVKRTRIAVTPGEIGLVPDFIEQVINIRPRLIDMTTIVNLLNELELDQETRRVLSDRYIQKIIDLSKRITRISHETRRMSEHLKQVVDGVHDGILAVNREGIITVFNGILEDILDVRGGRVIGRRIEDIIDDPDLVQFITSEQDEPNRYFTLGQNDIMVHRLTIDADQSRVATFKNAGETLEMERRRRHDLVKKGHYAKYHFNDIVGHNATLQETKRIATKLAASELTVLIDGESGTGKELFASSIHNASPRRNGPYLAVNFSALPEELVESELFGHEEGAFTGARKGGRKGLFEQAHGGTLFLDEIGDISLKVQARLLRVLQEKELLRVGGTDIIPVDVRIVAATNRNLLSMIRKEQFREDLYHRLKVLYLHLPPLRQRRDDIEELVRYAVHQSVREEIQISPEVFRELERYPWYGNIRELRNTIDYMLAVCDDNELRPKDIPDAAFFQSAPTGDTPAQGMQPTVNAAPPPPSAAINPEELDYILRLAGEQQQETGKISRHELVKRSDQAGRPFTEQQIRHRLHLLQEQGYIHVYRGRTGSRLTQKGFGRMSELSGSKAAGS
ncbi:MAG: sigma 54-interacting transcriptional regulator [Natronospirillum sp.]|uniref:sigma-54 interaction domain-containing protein n=1 Tax=Natronospirillum sp. TaxID=2812955 RepID=UPI0025D9F743|nr:sigma 54-interacting transcriptional regulator [Natronospirillum sp.]MCH8552947.1 sigma 54-interacting transcriptional regulator [Natronospirillum sp.]